MQYKGFIWRHRPKIWPVHLDKKGRRIIEGDGEFVGDDAYEQFKELALAFHEDMPGELSHPSVGKINANFVSLFLRQAPRPGYVAYHFEFWENEAGV